MNTFVQLAAIRSVGKLCKRSTWIIAVLGVLYMIVQVYTQWEERHGYQSTPGLRSLVPWYADFFAYLSPVLQIGINIVFYCSILYTIGAIITAFTSQTQGDDAVTYASARPQGTAKTGN